MFIGERPLQPLVVRTRGVLHVYVKQCARCVVRMALSARGVIKLDQVLAFAVSPVESSEWMLVVSVQDPDTST